MRISDWSSDVCSSDLSPEPLVALAMTFHPSLFLRIDAFRGAELHGPLESARLISCGSRPRGSVYAANPLSWWPMLSRAQPARPPFVRRMRVMKTKEMLADGKKHYQIGRAHV